MRRTTGLLAAGIASLLFGCAGPDSDYKHFQRLVREAPVSISREYGGYARGFASKLNCDICYRVGEPREEKLIDGLLSYFSAYYPGFLEKAVEKSNKRLDKDGPFYGCVTLDGLDRAVREIVGHGYEKEMNNALKLILLEKICQK